MARFHLRQHVHFCEIGDERIFLDLETDRYFSLPPAADRLLSTLLGNHPLGKVEQAEALLSAGLLVEAPDGKPLAATRHPTPEGSLLEEGLSNGLSFSSFPEVCSLVLRARRAISRKQLPRLLDKRGAPGGSALAEAQVRDVAVRDFMQARRLVPVAPNCLYDSLALRRFLQRRRIGADLVIGAKLHPFGAHCWLQDGTTVLNDSLATARGFAPILVA